MQITLAETAGFCFGVNRAVETVYKLLDEGEKVCTLGPIIHNAQLVEELASRGVRTVEKPEDVKTGETLVIRSHGVTADVINRAKNLGVELVDATCPFVSKIHKIVEEASRNGHAVLIAGDAKHQEVLGIMGHCEGPCFVFSSEKELVDIAKNHPELEKIPVTVVSQTTFNKELFKKSQKTLKKVYTNAIIFDTICNATSVRQQEAAELSKASDVMIVIGGRHSSNTKKLEEVCSEFCDRTFLIETEKEFLPDMLVGAERIGVVAGASTPAGIIKEVLKTMTEIITPVEGQESNLGAEAVAEKSFDEMTFEEAFEASLNSLNTDKRVKGTVLAVNSQEIQVDIGRKYTGIVKAEEWSDDPSSDMVKEVKVGDVIDLILMKTNDQEGTVLLSKRRFDRAANWNVIVDAKEADAVLEGTVTEVIKGGIIVVSKGIRVFVPASQATANRGESLEELKGKTVSFKILEIGRGRRVIGSIRAILREQRKAEAMKFWENVAEGTVYTGVVKSLTSYGAFVDLGGVDGMIHISELSWTRIKNPAEVLSVGDTVEVYIKSIDTEKKKISLGYKKASENPWEIIKTKYEVGSVAKVKIVSVTSYGAFANVIPGIDGLIHISQLSNKHVAKPQDVVSVGDEVEAEIINIDFDAKRVSLSIKALLPEEPETEESVGEVAPVTEDAAIEVATEEVSETEETVAE